MKIKKRFPNQEHNFTKIATHTEDTSVNEQDIHQHFSFGATREKT